jgi:hypothetical protein
MHLRKIFISLFPEHLPKTVLGKALKRTLLRKQSSIEKE